MRAPSLLLAFLLCLPMVAAADCVVKCWSNQDCALGEYCLNPGSCDDSNCSRGTLLELTQMEAQAKSGEVATFGLLGIQRRADRNIAIISVLNGAYVLYPEDATVTVLVDPLLGRDWSAVDPRHDVTNSTLRVNGPLVTYHVPRVVSVENFLLTFRDRNLTEEDLRLITVVNISYPRKVDDDYVTALEQTRRALTLIMASSFNGSETLIELNLLPKTELTDVAVPIELPKCLAADALNLTLSGNYRIVRRDPLVVWQFDSISEPQQILIRVPGDVLEECKKWITAAAIARRVGKPLSPWLALLIIPALAAILYYFQRFGPPPETEDQKPEQQAQADAARSGDAPPP